MRMVFHNSSVQNSQKAYWISNPISWIRKQTKSGWARFSSILQLVEKWISTSRHFQSSPKINFSYFRCHILATIVEHKEYSSLVTPCISQSLTFISLICVPAPALSISVGYKPSQFKCTKFSYCNTKQQGTGSTWFSSPSVLLEMVS